MHYSSEINSSLNINQLSLPLSFTDFVSIKPDSNKVWRMIYIDISEVTHLCVNFILVHRVCTHTGSLPNPRSS